MNQPRPLDVFGDPGHPDTICGIATPLGRGGIGIIRLSGPRAMPLAEKVFHGKHASLSGLSHRVLYGNFCDPGSDIALDEILLTPFKQPNSYTGEDVVEFSFHGSPTILRRALEILIAGGARLAQPGEFTFRAFYHGRIDLTQAEAVADLVDAKSEQSAQAAFQQLQGTLKNRIQTLRADLIEGLGWLEMSADFVEEDLEFKKVEEIGERINSIAQQISVLSKAYQRSRIVRDGLVITIIGAPNAGKSSLFNYLLARERSIVTSTPGTTRDTIDEFVNLGGYPVRFVDTAGIRKTAETVETIGIDRTINQLSESDLIFWVVDGSVGLTEDDYETHQLIADRPAIALINKADIATGQQIDHCRRSVDLADVIVISAATGKGIDQLIDWLTTNHLNFATDRRIAPFLINQRHLIALEAAREHLALADRALVKKESYEFVAFDLRKAAECLGEITGETTPDDILSQIFANFCIGK